ncbi:UNKNOWN [Stylonychia lemnae]|uniref:Uncharacterized protein n=1 Tax=Stylonychia lemnae TaxID=5949 RepID=A0A078AU03_STYLE|nr:UNKNOWN [Stylonychia lemnae]|eukprot:CDW85880.1 UNKNOWN [Stylonychia lemnae]
MSQFKENSQSPNLRDKKIQNLIRNADVYDLIQLQMKASENKISSIDRFINIALQNQIDSENMNPGVKIRNSQQQTQGMNSNPNASSSTLGGLNRNDTEKTLQVYGQDSPIKESKKWIVLSKQSSPSNSSIYQLRNHAVTTMKSPQRQPFTENSNIISLDERSSDIKSQQQESPGHLKLPLQQIKSTHESSLRIEDSPEQEQLTVQQQPQAQPIPQTPTVESNEHLYDHIREQLVNNEESPTQNLFKFQMQPVKEGSIIQSEISCSQDRSHFQETDILENNSNQNLTQSENLADMVRELTNRDQQRAPQIYNRSNYCKPTQSSQNKFLPTSAAASNQILDQQKDTRAQNQQSYLNKLSNAYQSSKSQHRSKSNNNRDRSTSNNARSVVGSTLSRLNNEQSAQKFNINLNQVKGEEKEQDEMQGDGIFTCKSNNTYQTQFQTQDNRSQATKVIQQAIRKQQSKKQKLNASFKEINLGVFVEIGRIKKPSKQAQQTLKMFCQLVNALRDRPLSEDFSNWQNVQYLINQNVNKFTQEVLSIKSRLIDFSYSYEPFIEIKEQYFQDEAQYQQSLIQSSSDKNCKMLTVFVYNVVHYVLHKQAKLQRQATKALLDQSIVSGSIYSMNTIGNNESPSKSINASIHSSVMFNQNVSQSQRNHSKLFNPSASKQNNNEKADVSPMPNRNSNKSPINQPSTRLMFNTKVNQISEIQEKRHNFVSSQVHKTPVKISGSLQGTLNGIQSSKTARQSQEKTSMRDSNTKKQPATYSSNQSQIQGSNAAQQEYMKSGSNQVVFSGRGTMTPNNNSGKPQKKQQITQVQVSQRLSSKSPMRFERKLPNFVVVQSQKHTPIAAKDKPEFESFDKKFQSPSRKDTLRIIENNNQCVSPVKVDPIQSQQEQQEEKQYEMSPGRIKGLAQQQCSHMFQMILDKAQVIQENIMTENHISKKIDLGIIEELKRRRREGSQVRQSGNQLEIRRDEIIQQVQKNLQDAQSEIKEEACE